MKFMKNLAVGEKNHIIVSDAIRMIRELGSGTLMEGVETREQERLLQDMGCGLLQGYLFNKPRSFDRIMDEVRNGAGLTYEKPEEGVTAP
jgi:EAL domain-containing protein (putative c-di-GMP-specific phosphodiesterase class I)